jgi:multidrug efflux pump subunit AcrB
MQGAARALFAPLSLAVGFSMLASYLLANSLVPVLAVFAFRRRHAAGARLADVPGTFGRLRQRYARYVAGVVRRPLRTILVYALGCTLLIGACLPRLGTDIFPRVDAGQLQLRLRAAAGTQLELTALETERALHIIAQEAGADAIQTSLALVGVHGSAYPINFIHLWNSGPQESVLQVQFRPGGAIDLSALRERLRARFAREMPRDQFSFEPGDIVSRVMSFGASTPIEVAVSGPSLETDRAYAERVRVRLASLPMLRDVQFGQPLDYPSLSVAIDRERAGVLGVTASDVTRSLTPATSSSRFTQPVYWAAPNGVAYQVQVEVPQGQVTSIEDLRNIPVSNDRGFTTPLRSVASVKQATVIGEYDRYDMARLVTVSANIERVSLGAAAAAVTRALQELGAPPARVSVAVRGEVQPLGQLLQALQFGLLLAVAVIFLVLVANFQSWQLALVTIASVPAVVAGVCMLLWMWRTTLNLESFMGAIMAVGVAVANAILLVTFAERSRVAGQDAADAAASGAVSRLRPILMTSLAMIAGMLPMALGFGNGGQQAAPLGRAVIGGLALATVATLLVLPALFALVRARAGRSSTSLDPEERPVPGPEP